jgi:hypothetical protein
MAITTINSTSVKPRSREGEERKAWLGTLDIGQVCPCSATTAGAVRRMNLHPRPAVKSILPDVRECDYFSAAPRPPAPGNHQCPRSCGTR